MRDDAPLTNPIFPEVTKLLAAQRLAKGARVIQWRDPVAQKGQQAFGDRRMVLNGEL